MVKYTPGGARNFLVPVAPVTTGNFYALAESPQLFKQLFMVAGYDRYFQIVRCFRDEDLRLDRQPEFTQIDVEMSFVNQDDIFTIGRGPHLPSCGRSRSASTSSERYPSGRFPRMPFERVMRRYGNDKPDLRFGLEHIDSTELIVEHDGGGIPLSRADRREVQERASTARICRRRSSRRWSSRPSANFSRADVDELEKYVKAWAPRASRAPRSADDGSWTQSPLAKTVTRRVPRGRSTRRCGAKDGRLILLPVRQERRMVHTVMANLRVHVGQEARAHPRERAPRRRLELPVGRRTRRSSSTTTTTSAGPRRTTPSRARTTSAST